jgi:Ca2+-binding EF-hand superfamily protein
LKNDGKRYLRSLDENHDARISREEFLATAKKRFAKLDASGDGVISAQEARAAKARLAERKAKSDARRLAQGKPVRRRSVSARPPRPYLANVDANRDGRVTRKEFLARREKTFVELDQNRDGVISKDEAKAAKAKKLARRAERQAELKERQVRKAARDEARVASQALEPAAAAQAPESVATSPAP